MRVDTLIAIFSQRFLAEEAITTLENEGYNPKDISIVTRQRLLNLSRAKRPGLYLLKDALSGAIPGAILGGLIAILIVIGAINLQGDGLFIFSPILSALFNMPANFSSMISGILTGLIIGGVLGIILGIILPDGSQIYQERLQEGSLLIAIPVTHEEERKVREILQSFQPDMIRIIHNEPIYIPQIDYSSANIYYSQVYPLRPRHPTREEPYQRPPSYDLPVGNLLPLFFKELEYPISKRDIIRYAESVNADEIALSKLESLSDKIYDSLEELQKELRMLS